MPIGTCDTWVQTGTKSTHGHVSRPWSQYLQQGAGGGERAGRNVFPWTELPKGVGQRQG